MPTRKCGVRPSLRATSAAVPLPGPRSAGAGRPSPPPCRHRPRPSTAAAAAAGDDRRRERMRDARAHDAHAIDGRTPRLTPTQSAGGDPKFRLPRRRFLAICGNVPIDRSARVWGVAIVAGVLGVAGTALGQRGARVGAQDGGRRAEPHLRSAPSSVRAASSRPTTSTPVRARCCSTDRSAPRYDLNDSVGGRAGAAAVVAPRATTRRCWAWARASSPRVLLVRALVRRRRARRRRRRATPGRSATTSAAASSGTSSTCRGSASAPTFATAASSTPTRPRSDDGRAWTLGVSFTYHFGRAASAGGARSTTARPAPGATTSRFPTPTATASPTTRTSAATSSRARTPIRSASAARRPTRTATAFRTPTTPVRCAPPGGTPDPKRPGCPLLDADGDGIADADDACPTKPGVASPDSPTRTAAPPRRSAARSWSRTRGPRRSRRPPRSRVTKRKMH